MADASWRGRIVAGRFRLEERIGRGGYGTVYRARQLSVDRDVALKLVHGHLQDLDDVRARFAREARLASRLRHDNAVRVIDFGEDGNTLFLAMEFLDGPTLKAAARSGDVSTHCIVPILRGIASALAAAHAEGLVHRDLKPGNVILLQTADAPRPVVIDFGLVKAFEDGPEEDLTKSNALVGTPAYLSPEAVQGAPLDHRSDLYSLGVMAYELLAGRKPVQGSNAMETAMAHLRGDIEPLERHACIEPALAELVHELLATRASERPDDASAVVARLDAIASGGLDDPTTTIDLARDEDRTRMPQRGPASRTSAPSPSRRPPMRAIMAVVAVLALLALVVAGVVAPAGSEHSTGDREPAASEPTVAASPQVQNVGAEATGFDGQTPEVAAPPVTAPQVAEGQQVVTEDQQVVTDDQQAVAEDQEVVTEDQQVVTERPSRVADPSVARRAPRVQPPEPTLRPTEAVAVAEPEPAELGSITVNVAPFGEVWVDGQRVGEAPIRRLEVAAGDHVIETRYAGEVRQEHVHVRAGAHVPVTHRFAIRR